MEQKNNPKEKGFDMFSGRVDTNLSQPTNYQGLGPAANYNSIKINSQIIDDAVIDLGSFKKVNSRLGDKKGVLKAIADGDLIKMREISDFFYKTSGIYSRIIRYMAFMYRYDWFVTPYVYDKKMKQEKLLDNFYNSLKILDKFEVKKTLGEIALKVLRFGAYYGYKIKTSDGITLQELPVNYCRSRFFSGKHPVVEFHMRYFDDYFQTTEIRNKILKTFPKEIQKGYQLYKLGKLPPQFRGDSSGWYLLDPDQTVKFTANGEDYPAFISVIPLIIDLDEAQELDRKKSLQRLLKIVVQKMPLDKNGDLIFDIDEARELHNNAIRMLSRAIGIDVLTTFADVEVADMETTAAAAQTDDLARVERQLFNEAGVSQMQFNTDGNIALEKSILNDEATMYNMLLQFEQFLNDLLKPLNSNKKKVEYTVQLLTTTIYNYKEMAKLYKEQMQVGFSKMLPQVALGQTQSSILAGAYFENDILDLVNVFIPPLMSSTMNADILNRVKGGDGSNGKADSEGPGRKELDNDQKSEKTIANRESMN